MNLGTTLYGYENILTLGLAGIGFLVTLFAQIKIKSTYSKYKEVLNKKNITGRDTARKILDANGLHNIGVESVAGELTDHYDPSKKVVRLSEGIYAGNDISAMSVAAHECGHAIQDKIGYTPMQIRSKLVPVVNLITKLGYVVMAISLVAGAVGYFKIALITILATLVFQVVTLPVEFDASRRALIELKNLNIAEETEISGSRSVLGAAALTYVASVLSTIFSVLRIVVMMSGKRK